MKLLCIISNSLPLPLNPVTALTQCPDIVVFVPSLRPLLKETRERYWGVELGEGERRHANMEAQVRAGVHNMKPGGHFRSIDTFGADCDIPFFIWSGEHIMLFRQKNYNYS